MSGVFKDLEKFCDPHEFALLCPDDKTVEHWLGLYFPGWNTPCAEGESTIAHEIKQIQNIYKMSKKSRIPRIPDVGKPDKVRARRLLLFFGSLVMTNTSSDDARLLTISVSRTDTTKITHAGVAATREQGRPVKLLSVVFEKLFKLEQAIDQATDKTEILLTPKFCTQVAALNSQRRPCKVESVEDCHQTSTLSTPSTPAAPHMLGLILLAEPVRPRREGQRLDNRHFKGRTQKLEELRRLLLWDGAVGSRLINVLGFKKIGKSAILSQLCSEVENGRLGQCSAAEPYFVDTLVCIICQKGCTAQEAGSRVAVQLFHSIGKVLERSQEFKEYGGHPLADRVAFLLENLRVGRHVLVLDDFENTLSETGEIEDPSLQAFINAMTTSLNSLRIIVTCDKRVKLQSSGSIGAIREVKIHGGLEMDEAISLLRDRYPDGGLDNCPEDHLVQIAERCKCIPNSLVEAACILYNRGIAPCELNETPDLLDSPFDTLYNELKPEQRQVLGALAVWNHPVPANAVSYLLPDLAAAEAEDTLRALCHCQFVSNQNGLYRNEFERDEFYKRIPDKARLQERQVDFIGEETYQLRRGLRQTRKAHKSRAVKLQSFVKEAAIALEAVMPDELSRGRLCLHCAEHFKISQEFNEVLSMANKAFVHAELAGDYVTMAKCLSMRATVEVEDNKELGRFDLIEAAIIMARNLQDPGLEEHIQRERVQLCLRRPEWFERAREALDDLTRIKGRLGERSKCAEFRIWQMRGELLAQRREWQDALDCFRQAKTGCIESQYGIGECAATGWLGLAQCHLGDIETGLLLVREALRFERYEINSREGVAKWLHFLGEMFEDREEYSRALHSLWLSEGIREELRHSDLRRTQARLAGLEVRLGSNSLLAIRKAFEPKLSEFAEFVYA